MTQETHDLWSNVIIPLIGTGAWVAVILYIFFDVRRMWRSK